MYISIPFEISYKFREKAIDNFDINKNIIFAFKIFFSIKFTN